MKNIEMPLQATVLQTTFNVTQFVIGYSEVKA